MMKVKLKTDKIRLFIPIPYIFLRIGITILSSTRIQKKINELIVKEQKTEDANVFVLPPLDKNELRAIVNELKKHRGFTLVDVKANDGTEVVLKL